MRSDTSACRRRKAFLLLLLYEMDRHGRALAFYDGHTTALWYWMEWLIPLFFVNIAVSTVGTEINFNGGWMAG
jgi:hypothetical protein